MPDRDLIIRVMAVAAGIAATSLLIFGWPWRAPNRSRLILGWTVGLGAGFFAGCLLLQTTVHFPLAENAEASDRLLLIVLPVAMLVEGLSSLRISPRGVIWLPRILLAVFVTRILLHNSTFLKDLPGANGAEWSPQEQWLHFAVLGGALLILWMALEVLIRKSPARSIPLSMSVACVGSAVTIMCSGTATGGELAFPMAGALAGGFLASCLMPSTRDGDGFLGVGLTVLLSVLIIGRYFAQLKDWQGALLFFSLLLCWLPELPPLRKLRPLFRDCLRIMVVCIPIALVTLKAWDTFQEDSGQRSQPGEPTMEDYGNFKD
jgi:hypothetical protein